MWEKQKQLIFEMLTPYYKSKVLRMARNTSQSLAHVTRTLQLNLWIPEFPNSWIPEFLNSWIPERRIAILSSNLAYPTAPPCSPEGTAPRLKLIFEMLAPCYKSNNLRLVRNTSHSLAHVTRINLLLICAMSKK